MNIAAGGPSGELPDHGLAVRLRLATQPLHVAAERSGAMRRLLRGELPLDRYRALLASLLAIYEALEAALQVHAAHPLLAPLHEPRLWRSAALRQDLAALGGIVPALPAEALAYAAHLRTLAESAPARLVAHAYTRYLGDVSGGQILGPRVAQCYGLADGAGTAFYRFDPPGAAVLASAFRAGLASLAPEPALEAELLDEARQAFARHVALFDALAPG